MREKVNLTACEDFATEAFQLWCPKRQKRCDKSFKKSGQVLEFRHDLFFNATAIDPIYCDNFFSSQDLCAARIERQEKYSVYYCRWVG